MLPTSFLLCVAGVLVGLESFGNAQLQKNQQKNQPGQLNLQEQGDYSNSNHDRDVENTYSSVEHLIAAASKNGGRRSSNKKNSRSSDDDYHEVYESKPQSYSNSYHHSDSYKEPTRSTSYGNNGGGNSGGGGYGRNTYSNNPSRRKDRGNYQEQAEDYDDYDDSPRQKNKKPTYEDEDYDQSEDTRSGQGYDHEEKFDKSQKDDYHKSGKLKDDFDEFGREGQRSNRGFGPNRGRSGGSGGRRNSYSNSDGEIGDSDYVDDDAGFSSTESGGRGGGRSREREDNPIDRYEQKTRKALREYGTLDGGAFLNANQYKKK